MPVAEPLNIKLGGPAFEPTVSSWSRATPARRLDYWKHFGEFALDVKRQEIRKGIGIDGRKLKAVKPTSRPDGATGPPLIPHYAESRTAALLALHVTANGVTLFWRGHGRKSWAKILGYHAYKHGPRALPVRNIIGISPAGLRKATRNARDWWDLTSRDAAVTPPKPKPEPEKPTKPPKRVPDPRDTDKVIYLKKGEKPDPKSKKIQVYETRGRKPKGTPPPPPAPKVPKPKPPAPKPVASVVARPTPTPTPTPSPTPSPSFADQMKPRVDAEIKSLVGEFAAAKKRNEAADARWKAVKGTASPASAEYQQARQEAAAAFEALAAVVDRGKRFERWKRDVKANPDLIPPFAPAERLKIYAERGGAEKLKRLQDLDAPAPPERLAELNRTRRQLQATVEAARPGSKEQFEALKTLNRINDERRELVQRKPTGPPLARVVEAIRPGETLKLEADLTNYRVAPTTVPVEPALIPRIVEGLGYLRQVVGKAGLPPLKVPVGMVPRTAKERSFCSANGIALDHRAETRVFVHEFGHHLDNQVGPGAAVDFLRYRVGNEPSQPLKDIFPTRGYGPLEMGRKDRFDDAFGDSAWYVGKDYQGHASEVTSMGLEKLFTDPVGFAKNDPEYCSFILGMLDGSLR